MKIKHIELMEQYAKQILKNLQSLAIKGTYSLEESLVYGFSESYFGDIYCVYCLEKDILTCFALFQSKVSKKTEDIILGDLEGLNKEVGGGYFYIDSILSRITFAVDYDISKGTDTLAFDRFCTFWYDHFKNHRQILFWTITGNLTKHIKSDLN